MTTALHHESRVNAASRPVATDARPKHPATDIGTTLVVDLRNDVGPGYARHATGDNASAIFVSDSAAPSLTGLSCLSCDSFVESPVARLLPLGRIVLCLPLAPSTIDERVIDRCITLAAQTDSCRVCIVSSFRVHFGDQRLVATEAAIRERFDRVTRTRCAIVRPGNVLGEGTRLSKFLQALAPLHPLAANFRSCFVGERDLWSMIDDISRAGHGRNGRNYTLLGANRSLQEVLAERIQPEFVARTIELLARTLSFLLVGCVAGSLYGMLASRRRSLKRWQCDSLAPVSVDELLSLYNPYNLRYVAIAGYNTGVTHFGWKYPGRTVLKTVVSGKRTRAHNSAVDVDAGVTLKRVVGELSRVGRELYVLPNYSYISMGTAFFVPIHGSGSEVSTLGHTIERVLLYDPAADRLIRVKRGDARFGHYMYNPRSIALALRLRFRVREKSRYYVQRSSLESPSAADVWYLFADPEASNIELRKSRAADTTVAVHKYYTAPTGEEQVLEVPKDSIGRLWDRLEENPVTSWLFHALVRRFGYHVELFLDEREFAVFWAAHATLPLSKIQLRFVRRDGLPHSPFGDRDCISADLFMRRSASPVFRRFIQEQLPHARFNPGKHSV